MPDLETSIDAVVRSTDSGRPYGVTTDGFVPKPIGRLIEEKLAGARYLFGDNVDLTAGSSIRKLLELMAVEEARMWEHLGHYADNTSVATARGAALSALGAELGVIRPHHRARGLVTLELAGDLPVNVSEVALERGTRLVTEGGHDLFLDERVELAGTLRSASAVVVAFDPGPELNLDPAEPGQLINAFNPMDHRSAVVRTVHSSSDAEISIVHSEPLVGGERVWSDEDYRDLLLAFPRNPWTPDTIRAAVSRVSGVRQAQVKDLYGGLDIHQSIFGNFSFIERLFSEERSLGSPYYLSILVAPGPGAIWSGPGQLKDRVQEAVDRIRPAGVFPNILQATEIGVTIHADLTVEGLPVPAGTPDTINADPEAIALKGRILTRLRRYVSGLSIGSKVRHAEIVWAIMEEPGVVDAKNVRLFRSPVQLSSVDLSNGPAGEVQDPRPGDDVTIGQSEVASLVEDLDPLRII